MDSRIGQLAALPCIGLVVLLGVPFSTQVEKEIGALPTGERYERAVTLLHDESLSHARLTLNVPAGAVEQQVVITIQTLAREQVAKLDPGMVNVTPNEGGFRLGPHGLTFAKPAEIILPYDPALLEPGYSEDDLYTFYYDEEGERWQALPRTTIDQDQKLVTSTTTHFTDFITGLVTVPDHPEVLGYTPTSMKDIQTADPGTRIQLIEPPRANSLGDAGLSYPIDLPRGRLGIQPDLSISYNSSGGNGWLGLGWDLSAGAITIDTRFGVPRNDAARETETYLLDGAMLTPVAHRGELQARSSEKVFHTRVEGEFRKIIRHGSSPGNYWWEVVATNGMRYFYGGDPEGNTPIGNATLTDDLSNVFSWALREVRDLHGNGISYQYDKVTDTGISGGTVDGFQLYLRTIDYTRINGTAGPYTVTFVRDSQLPGYSRRPDVTIDCRGGFKMVTAELLKRIDVNYQGQLVRRYELSYDPGAFHKTLLESITLYGEDGAEFHTHKFEYYDEIRDDSGSYKGFAAREEWNTRDDRVGLSDLQPFGHGSATALSGARGFSVGGHVYVGVGTLPSKTNSGGAKIGYNFSQTNSVLALVDINGDSLPDKVFLDGGEFYFRLNQGSPGDSATTDFGPSHAIPTLPHLSRERSQMVSGGAEGYPGGANLIANQAVTWTAGVFYLQDVNADGLPDLVSRGEVLFNHLDADGIPVFTSDSADTLVPIGSGAVDTTDLIEDHEEDYQNNIDMFPLHDTLRRWVAPYDGEIEITGDVTLPGGKSPEPTDDGVQVAIQHNGSELWSADIDAGDDAPRTPTGVEVVPVQAGDRIYFRVQSILDGSNDRVSWDPQIQYLGAPDVTDVNLLNPYRFRASEDFVLAGRPGTPTELPFNGTVRLEGGLTKSGVTTDNITLEVVHNGAVILTRTLGWDAVGEIDPTLDFAVVQDDFVELRVRVDSPIDVSLLSWVPRLYYISSTDPDVDVDDKDGNYIIQLDPPYDVDLYPFNNLDAHQGSWTAPKNVTVVMVRSQLEHGLLPDPSIFGEVMFTVKRPGELVAKHTVTITAGIVNNVSFDTRVKPGDQLYFDYSVRDPALAAVVFGSHARVEYKKQSGLRQQRESGLSETSQVPAALHYTVFTNDQRVGKGLYNMPYRGWSYAAYNGNRERALLPIDESLLVLPDDPAEYDITTTDAYAFSSIPKKNFWRGPDDLGWVAPGEQSSSRLGADQIDVPRSDEFAGARAVNRLTRTFQTTVGAGVSILSASLTVCPIPPPVSRSVLDFMDMNGDRFPDIVSEEHVQYTTLVGGLEENKREVLGLTPVRRSLSATQSVGLAGNPTRSKSDAKAQTDTSGQSAPKENSAGSQMVRLGVGGAVGLGRSEVDRDLMDVNGDGLPDRVSTGLMGDELTVSLNLGYRFAAEEPWGESSISSGANANATLSGAVGFNSPARHYGIAGGLALTLDESRANQSLIDINGDGLPDRVTPARVLFPFVDPCIPGIPFGFGEHLLVALNTGSGFAANEIEWDGADVELGIPDFPFELSPSDELSVSQNVSLGAGVYATFPIPIPTCPPGPCVIFIIINPGADGSVNLARQRAALIDVNGDGFLDHVTSTEDSSMSVALNPIGRTNLLKRVVRPLGATIELEYARDGNTVQHPGSRWVLSRVEVFDGFAGDGADSQLTTYRYEGGFQNRLEREFYGYGRVSEEHRDADNADALLRSVVREYGNDSYYTRGLLKRVLLKDADGNPYVETEHTYLLRDVETGNEPADPSSTTATLFPLLVRTDQRFYEGNPVPGKSTYTTHQYDAVGNMTEFFDAADVGAEDDIHAFITYSRCDDSLVFDQPTSILLTTGGDPAVARRREATIQCATGQVLQIREFINDSTAAATDLEYSANGNLQRVTGPENLHGQRYSLMYEYDLDVSTYVTSVSDSFGYSSKAQYNLRHGEIETNVDTNGNQTNYLYDKFGRLTSVTGPYEQGTGSATIQFEYHPEATVPWAISRHFDPFVAEAGNTIDTVVFTDGLQRVIQTKKDAAIHAGPDSATEDVFMVSGRISFDALGRTGEQHYPVTEPLGSPGLFNPVSDTVVPTEKSYDILDRNTVTLLPDGTGTSLKFDFGPDRLGIQRFKTSVTNAGSVESEVYKNVKNYVTGVKEFYKDGSLVLWTSYAYDPFGNLVETSDDSNNVSTMDYDLLGRRVSVNHPDAGLLELVYDPASNVIAKITPQLRPQGRQISYDYDFNSLESITYPNFPENNISYEYGAAGASDNRTGRVTIFTHESGSTERFYGKLGEIVREIRTIVPDAGGQNSPAPQIYETHFSYDTWGRLRTLIYPDGEVLTYGYDSGGLVHDAVGHKGAFTYDYLSRMEYDKFAARAFMEVGNGVRTTYAFRSDNRRLATIQSGAATGNPFQNLAYTYDLLGNITKIINDVPVGPPSAQGGPVEQTFVYDDLSRLIQANGRHEFKPNQLDRYNLAIDYDPIHNISHKDQLHERVKTSGQAVVQSKTTYDWFYDYAGPQPHAVTRLDERSFSYDAAGNQLGWEDGGSGQKRTILWDEENRIQRIFDNGHELLYKYDDAGVRIYKVGPQGETAYANPHYTVRNGTIGTKHVFIGDTRLSSKRVKQNEDEKDLFFYHTDHLGSSNYITDIAGALYQHLQYFPSGEVWVAETSDIQPTPYRFSGDEMDEETGLYYVNPRYHDPRQGQLLGADPLWTNGSGAVDSISLNVFVYARHNPLLFIESSAGVAVSSDVDGILEAVFGDFNPATLAGAPAFAAGVSATVVSATGGSDSEDAADKTMELTKQQVGRIRFKNELGRAAAGYAKRTELRQQRARATGRSLSDVDVNIDVPDVPRPHITSRGQVKQLAGYFERLPESQGLVKRRLAGIERQAELRELGAQGLVKRRLAQFERQAQSRGLVRQRVTDFERPMGRGLVKRIVAEFEQRARARDQGLKP